MNPEPETKLAPTAQVGAAPGLVDTPYSTLELLGSAPDTVVHDVPFQNKMAEPPTAHTPPDELLVTPVSAAGAAGGAGMTLQLVPFQCSMSVLSTL